MFLWRLIRRWEWPKGQKFWKLTYVEPWDIVWDITVGTSQITATDE